MKRILSALLSLLLLCALPASAQEGSAAAELRATLIAEFNALTQQEEIAGLEKQILELQLSRSELMQDEAAVADFTAQLAAIEQTLATLALQKEDTAAAIITAINLEEEALGAEIASLTETLSQLQAQLAAAQTVSAALQEEAALYQPYADAVLKRDQFQVTATAKGFVSDVRVTVTMAANGTIMAVEADCSDEILGSRCEEPAFLNQFLGKKGPFTDVDVVTGSTYTSNAVIRAVNSLCGVTVKTASAKGLLSDVVVTVKMAEDGVIAAISVDASGETAAIAAPCTEDAFLSQFIGRKGPFHDIDVVTGATWTSNAVINAVNSLYE